MSRTELLRTVSHKRPEFPSDTWKYQLLADHVNVPQVETTYWCRVEKLPEALRQKFVLYNPECDKLIYLLILIN